MITIFNKMNILINKRIIIKIRNKEVSKNRLKEDIIINLMKISIQ